MTNRELTTKYRMMEWAEIFQDRAVSGLSIAKFCEERNIVKSRYFYWQKKLRSAACEHIEFQQHGETSLSVPGFAEVSLESTKSTPIANERHGQLCIEFNGMQISADSTYPPDKLAALLRELRR